MFYIQLATRSQTVNAPFFDVTYSPFSSVYFIDSAASSVSRIDMSSRFEVTDVQPEEAAVEEGVGAPEQPCHGKIALFADVIMYLKAAYDLIGFS